MISGNQLVAAMRPDSDVFNPGPVVQFPDDFGLLRIEGDDNVIVGTMIRTAGPAEHVPVVVTGLGNRLSGLEVRGEVPLDVEIALLGGALGRENAVTDARRPDRVDVAPGVWAIVQGLPGAFVG